MTGAKHSTRTKPSENKTVADTFSRSDTLCIFGIRIEDIVLTFTGRSTDSLRIPAERPKAFARRNDFFGIFKSLYRSNFQLHRNRRSCANEPAKTTVRVIVVELSRWRKINSHVRGLWRISVSKRFIKFTDYRRSPNPLKRDRNNYGFNRNMRGFRRYLRTVKFIILEWIKRIARTKILAYWVNHFCYFKSSFCKVFYIL